MRKFSRICAEISFDAIDHNIAVMEGRMGEGAKICAVIKADGYGHGALPIARHLAANDRIWGFACATPGEAMRLRTGGIIKPILILGYSFPESYDDIVDYDLRACVFDEESARLLSAKARMLERPVKVHVALDTGMGRIGFDCSDETVEAVLRIASLPMLEIEGLFSHFAKADEKLLSPAEVQLVRFLDIESKLTAAGLKIPLVHIANSAGIMRFSESHLDLVRAGIILYGLMPSMEVAGEMTELRPVMRLTSHLTYVKTVPEGTPISYGGTYTTARKSRIATVPVGYADGYPRSLSNKGFVLLRGKRAPITGRVCMDQLMIDVTDIPDAAVGDEVVLIGSQMGETITAEALGELSGRFNYELVCDLTMRVPRSYTAGGYTVEQVDYLL